MSLMGNIMYNRCNSFNKVVLYKTLEVTKLHFEFLEIVIFMIPHIITHLYTL